MPELKRLHDKYREKGLRIVGRAPVPLEGAPKTVKEGVNKDDAKKIKDQLTAADCPPQRAFQFQSNSSPSAVGTW